MMFDLLSSKQTIVPPAKYMFILLSSYERAKLCTGGMGVRVNPVAFSDYPAVDL
jgi:hypothetical protein